MSPSVETYRTAISAVLAAARHADAVVYVYDWPLGGGRWQDEAADHLYDAREELGEAAYQLALELLKEVGPRGLAGKKEKP